MALLLLVLLYCHSMENCGCNVKWYAACDSSLVATAQSEAMRRKST